MDVGERLRLVPYWEKAFVKEDRLNIVIDPGPAFGAGDHPSTIMAMELLELVVTGLLKGASSISILDVGTGTGVLTIAGKLLGVGFAVGLDIDPASVFSARRNAELNGPERSLNCREKAVELIVGGVESVNAKFQVVLANLAAPTLIRLADYLASAVGNYLILSGIADAMHDAVMEKYGSLGLGCLKSVRRNEWNAAIFHAKETSLAGLEIVDRDNVQA